MRAASVVRSAPPVRVIAGSRTSTEVRRVRRLVSVLVAIAALALAGTASTAVAATTKTEFIKRGDALCVRMARELAPLRQRAQAALTLPESKKWGAVAAI